jgi:hypothetical protein
LKGRRRLVAEGDVDTLAEARRLLGQRDDSSTARDWYVFEGPTSVDAYLETDDLIVVVEGMRTERGPTTRTEYMPVRHQMLRNFDAAYDDRGDRELAGFFIVEGRPKDGLVPDDRQDSRERRLDRTSSPRACLIDRWRSEA